MFRDCHPQCQEEADRQQHRQQHLRDRSKQRIQSAVEKFLLTEDRQAQIFEEASTVGLNDDEAIAVIIESADGVVESIIKSERLFTENEAAAYKKFINTINASRDDINKHGTITKIAMLSMLMDISQGVIPSRFNITGSLPFLINKSEKIVCATDNVDLYEQKTKKEYVGRSSGSSIRVWSGFWVRIGDSSGNVITSTVTEKICTGLFALTTKHIFFHSTTKSQKIKLDKIISIESVEGGVQVVKDGANPKPQWFAMPYGWFYARAIPLLANL